MIENRLKKGLGRGLSSLLGDSVKKIEKLLKTDENLNKNLEKLKGDILYNKKDEI